MAHMHLTPAAANRNRLAAVFFVTLGVFVFELVGGLAANSLALVADAGHLLTDLAGIGLTLVAIWFAGRPANRNGRSGCCGWRSSPRSSTHAAVRVAAYVLVEAWRGWNAPPEVSSGLMLAVAVIGLVANAASLVVLRDAQRESLAMRGAYLEVMGDLVGSVAVIVAAIVIVTTGWVQADALASVVHRRADPAAHVVAAERGGRRPAGGVTQGHRPRRGPLAHPRGAGRRRRPRPPRVDDHLGVNVVSAHVVLDETAHPPTVLDYLCGCLSGDFDIEHSTFQLETSDRRRLETAHHA